MNAHLKTRNLRRRTNVTLTYGRMRRMNPTHFSTGEPLKLDFGIKRVRGLRMLFLTISGMCARSPHEQE